MGEKTANKPAKELTMTRVFDAPRPLVFEAWTKREHLMKWWGPHVFTVPECEVDLRVGGVFNLCMRSPQGEDYWMRGAYTEVKAPERIVFTSKVDHPPPFETVTTVTFEEEGAKTKVTMHQTYSVETDATRGANEGWKQTLDRFAEHLKTVT